MFDKEILKDVIADYKRDFTQFQWENERYKWEAIQCFQQNMKERGKLQSILTNPA